LNSCTVALSLILLLPRVAQQEKKAPPSPAAQKDAEKLVRGLFREDYNKPAPSDRLALARKLIQQAIDTTDDPTARFVLLREARDVAAGAGDAELSFRAISILDVDFKIDAVALKHAILATVGKTARTPDEIKSLSGHFLKLATEAAEADEYDVAQQALTSASTFARNAKDIPLATRSAARAKEMGDLKARYERVKPAKARLAANPEDAAANELMGQYLCSVKGDWAAGLPLLGKAEDAALRSTALKELSTPSEASDQMSLGDFWWDRGEKETGLVRENLRGRAVFWYQAAVGRLAGLTKARIEKRISEIHPGRPPGDWLDITDPPIWNVDGKFGEEFALIATLGGTVQPTIAKYPEGAFDGIWMRIRFGPNHKVQGGVIFEAGTRLVNIDGATDIIQAYHLADGLWIPDAKAACAGREEYLLCVLIDKGDYVITVNGEEKLRLKATTDNFRHLTIRGADGTVTFDRMHLRRKK
jgi:hypothetical protein